jgi:hypothetical protein
MDPREDSKESGLEPAFFRAEGKAIRICREVRKLICDATEQ